MTNMEWIVVTVIIALVGLFMTVGKPIISLNKNITTLNVNFENMNRRLDKQEEAIQEQSTKAHESHKELWDKNAEQDKLILDHETRISVLEQK